MKSMKMPKSLMNIKFKMLKLFAELMTSKYFLIFLTALSTINIVGYLSMGYVDAVILFALVSFITFIFSKNMSVVLLVSVIIVNLFMNSRILESVSVGGKTDNSQQSGGYTPDVIALELEALTNMKDTEIDGDVEEEEAEVITETTTEEVPDDEDEEEAFIDKKMNDKKKKKPVEESFQQLHPATVKQHPHIDYGATLTDAYQNLEKMLGAGGLKNLTSDTKKLMEQQSKLFNSMENIAPLLSQAQDLMKKMDVTKFSGKMGGLADSAEPLGKSRA
jgi:hypothetical protein